MKVSAKQITPLPQGKADLDKLRFKYSFIINAIQSMSARVFLLHQFIIGNFFYVTLKSG